MYLEDKENIQGNPLDGKKENYADSGSHSPQLLRKRSHFGTGYRKTPPPKEKEKYQEGCRLDLKPSPDES
jgi:hypothetical protein